MGMMLRRRNRKPDYTPSVNGKPVAQEPKKRKLTEKKQPNNTNNFSNVDFLKNLK